MRRRHAREISNDRKRWIAAVIMVPVALGLFVLTRVIGPSFSVQAAALAAAVLGVGLVRGRSLLRARRRTPR